MRISDWSSDVCSSDLRRKSLGNAMPCSRSAASLARRSAIRWFSSTGGGAGVWSVMASNRSVECRSGFSRELLRLPTASPRSEEHTSELQSLMRISYAVFCLKKKKQINKKKEIDE